MRRLFVYLFVLFCAVIPAGLRAQDGYAIGDPAAAPGSPATSYALSGVDQVNRYNGKVNVSIPLVTIGGRGAVARTIGIPIQREWAVVSVSSGIYTPVTGSGYIGGLYTSGYMSVVSTGGNSWACYDTNSQQWKLAGPYVTYVVWTGYDGTQTYLVDTNSNGQPKGANVVDCASWSSYTQYNRGRTFVSQDGSGLTFVADQDVIDQTTGTVTGSLQMRDGASLRFGPSDSYLSQAEDRNGNMINFSFSSTSNGGIYTIHDAANRTESINFTEDLVHDQQDVITYPGPNGSTHQATVHYSQMSNAMAPGESIQTYSNLFPELNGASSSTQFNPWIISSITLADGTSYQMQYNRYGDLARLTLPTGGVYAYTYQPGSGVITLQNSSGYHIYRHLVERDEYADGSTVSARLLFTQISSDSGWDTAHPTRPVTLSTLQFQDGQGNPVRQDQYSYWGNPLSTQAPPAQPATFADWWEGLEYQHALGVNGSTSIQYVQNVYQQRGLNGENDWYGEVQADGAPPHDPELCQTRTTVDGIVVSGAQYGYDANNNLGNVWDYDYTASIPTVNGSCPVLPSDTDTSFTKRTNLIYGQGSAYNLVSLLTQKTVKDSQSNVLLWQRYKYDETAVAATPGIAQHDETNFGTSFNARGNLTSIVTHNYQQGIDATVRLTYDEAGNVLTSKDENNNTTTYTYTDGTYAHPNTITNAKSQTTQLMYDTNIGKPYWVVDPNGVATYYDYEDWSTGLPDPLDRLRLVAYASSTGDERKSTWSYPNPTTVIARQDQNTSGDGLLQTTTTYDGFGRPISTQVSDAAGDIFTTQTYNALGLVASQTNPYRSGDTINTMNYGYDAMGRVTSVQTPDGAVSTTSYNGNVTTAIDAAGHKRKTVADVFGRITQVTEDPDGLNYATNYSYDAMDNLTQVSQGSQTRTYTYDTQQNLIAAANPESGAVTYTYDPHGNLKTMKDARNITATLSYDVLNRLTSKTYNDGVTQPETWTYDPNIANGIGRVGSVSNGNSVATYLSYDGMGNILSSNQQTLGQTYSFSYTWNLAGALTSETYPSGRKVTTTYDGVNRLSAVNGQMGSTATAYMDHMNYLAQGAPSYFRMGNNVWRNFAYNREQQAGCHWDGIGGNPSYALFEECPSWGTANNNGTLKSNAVGAGGPMLLTSLPTMTATYGYDNLNRLTSASDSGGWARNWSYDRYGNMWMTNATGVPGSPLTPSSSGYFTSANRISGQNYDAAGNQTNYSTYTLTYNATNELTKVADATSGGSVQYTYDAAGRRVSKQFSDGAQRVFVYDALGQLAAEYSNAAQAPTPPCATCYLSTDYLGSVRMITDETGVAVARHDYLPFGEEVPGNMAGRSMLFGQDASVNQKFTGQERDTESNLDFFEARFMSSLQGRFLSPDPFSAGADVGDPQSWNGYAYVRGNPLNRIDPTGTSWIGDFVDNLSNLLKNGCGSDFCVSGTGVSDIDTSSNAIAWYLTIGSILSPPQSSPSPSQPYKFTVTGTANPPKNCSSALRVAGQTTAAVQRAIASWPILSGASAANSIDTRLLAALGVRETGFQNVTEADGAGVGVGVFQITVSPTSGVTAAQASNLPWAANYAANLLSSNGSYLSRRFPSFTPGQLLQATAASYNMNPYKPGNFTGNPNTIDIGTAHNNYGSNVVSLMSCFGN